MVKRSFFTVLLISAAFLIFGESLYPHASGSLPLNVAPQSPAMQVYLQRFIRADFTGKIDILNEALSDAYLDSSLLYEYALQFVLDNYAQIDDLRDMNTITRLSVNGLLARWNADAISDSNVINILWKFVLEYPNAGIKTDIIIALSILGKGNYNLIVNLNGYLMELNRLFNLGRSVDYSIVSACISALMELGDSSSYPVLFTVICSGYPEVISSESYGALEVIPGNLSVFLLYVIENYPVDEKFVAFRIVLNNEKMSVAERGQIAERTLSLSLLNVNEAANLSGLRYDAVILLTRLKWTRANALAIRHYYAVQADYQDGHAAKGRFLEAIECLGALGNSDAAFALGLQLSLINNRTQREGAYDAEITLAVVRALGNIGDNTAFNHLSAVTDLPYTDEIIAAAREAIDRIRW